MEGVAKQTGWKRERTHKRGMKSQRDHNEKLLGQGEEHPTIFSSPKKIMVGESR